MPEEKAKYSSYYYRWSTLGGATNTGQIKAQDNWSLKLNTTDFSKPTCKHITHTPPTKQAHAYMHTLDLDTDNGVAIFPIDWVH